MRDPAVNLAACELTEIAIQYLCQRELLELSEAINANAAASDELLKTYVWPADARAAEDRMLAFFARNRNRKRGRPQKRDRHIQIVGAIALLVKDEGLDPTRSHCGRRHSGPSACSMITAALAQLGEHLDERTVEGIWDRYRLSPLIIHQGATAFARAIAIVNRP